MQSVPVKTRETEGMGRARSGLGTVCSIPRSDPHIALLLVSRELLRAAFPATRSASRPPSPTGSSIEQFDDALYIVFLKLEQNLV